MTLVWVTFLLGFGVLTGMGALVVDLGYGMVQARAMQNAADAGAISAARLLAASVGQGPTTGTIAYVSITDSQVHARALDFATANRPSGGGGVTYAVAVEYRPCPGLASGSPNFTASSDAALVAAAGGTRQGAATAYVPSWTCSVRVHAQARFNSFFAGALGQPTQAATSRATARISPTQRPKVVTGLWPITRWLQLGTDCPYTPGGGGIPCKFWDPNLPPDGSWNGLVDMSRLSEVNNKTRGQLFWCGGGGPILPNPPATPACHDPTYPGNNGKTVDLPNWSRQGWRGQLFVDSGDTRCRSAATALTCGNSRLEVYPGTSTSAIDNAMKTFITNNRIGTEPGSLGDYTDLTVMLWEYAEQAISTSTNQGTVWSSGSSNKIDRMMIAETRRFRFYVGLIGNGAAGYQVSFETNGTPENGPPSSLANTVTLSE